MRRPLLVVVLLVVGPLVHAAEYPYAASEPDRVSCEPPPFGWEQPDFDDRSWAAPADTDTTTACPHLRWRRRFDVGPEREHLATLTVNVRYRDGLILYLNGREVARRRIAAAGRDEQADEPHSGSQPERFPIALAPGLLRPRGNVLALAVHSARPDRNAAVTVELEGADGPRFVLGPYLQRVGTREGWLIAETDLPTTMELSWRRLSNPEVASHVTRSTRPGRRHVLHLTHLSPATTYHYRLVAHSREPAREVAIEADFHTPPAGMQPLRIAVLGDVRSGHDQHAAIVAAIVAEDPDLVLMTGDLVERGSEEGDWERFFAIEAPLLRQVAVYPAVGNHEYVRGGRGLARFLSLFLRTQDSPWWSFDVAGVHIAIIDSEAYGNPAQLEWLDADLTAARERRARALFVVGHDGPYSSAIHGDNASAIRSYTPLYRKHRVSLVFSGHDHDYERLHVDGIDYIVTGGGGAELRPLRCGVPGRPTCGTRTRVLVNEHHYVMVEVWRNRVRLCPKRADGTLLEACPTFLLKR